MNDEEINEIIARNEEEVQIYREFDIKRERDALEQWKAQGNRGKPPPPLMQLEELPEYYRLEEPFLDKNEIDEIEGRGQRRRTVVNYNDGLSDDQWAMVSLPSSSYRLQHVDTSLRLWKRAKICRNSQSAPVPTRIDVR